MLYFAAITAIAGCRAFRCISQLIGGQILPDLFALRFGSDAFSAILNSVM